VLLGLMVEKAAGINYRDYILQHVFIPAGMNNSNFFWMDQVNDNVAEGADPIRNDDEIVGWKRNIYSFPPVGSPDAGAHVTAGDLDRFLRSMKDGRLVSQTLSDAFFTPQVHYREYEDWKMFYGYGMWFYVDRQGAVVCCQKEGINAGVSGMVRYFPKNDINVIILANMEEAAWKPIWHIHEMVTADVIIG